MVTTQKIRCVVVVASPENDRMPQPSQPRFRPSDLLPWADPHIRSLVEQLQAEVREEAATARRRQDDATTKSRGRNRVFGGGDSAAITPRD
ncbi:MAG: hypothetical protein AAF805_02605 [Planctomycetota bacterium]